MSKQYKERVSTGCEYVIAANNLFDYTLLICFKLPKRWENYILIPMVNAARKVVDQSLRANEIYINSNAQNQSEFAEALQKRVRCLSNTLVTLRIYLTRVDEVMRHVDITKQEANRIKDIISDLMAQTHVRRGGDVDGLSVKVGYDSFYYVSVDGNKKIKLRVTSQQKDHLIDLYNELEDQIKNRLVKDRSILKKMSEKQSKQHKGYPLVTLA